MTDQIGFRPSINADNDQKQPLLAGINAMKRDADEQDSIHTKQSIEYHQSTRKDYLDKFGIHFNLPCMSYLITNIASDIEAAFIYPKDPSFIILFINYYRTGDKADNNENEESEDYDKRISESIVMELKKKHQFQNEERQEREASILILQEHPQTYKIVYKQTSKNKLSKFGAFSPCGDFFAYKMEIGNIQIVRSSTFNQLIEMKTIKQVSKSPLQELISMKFSQKGESLALIYTKSFSLHDMTSQESQPPPSNIKFDDGYSHLLDIEFKNDSPMQGTAAMQINQGYNQTQVHFYTFDKNKATNMFRVFKFTNYYLINKFLFKFSPNRDKAIVSIVPIQESKKKIDTDQTYIVDIENECQYQLGEKKQLRAISILQNFGQASQRPFICLAADPMGDEMHLMVDDEKQLKLNFPFSKNNTEVLFFDSRIVKKETVEFQIRVGLLVDKERICVFSYREGNQSGFDNMLGRISRSVENIDLLDQAEMGLSYREYEEFQVSNFVYPCIAYNYLSKQIRILYLDNSSETQVLKIPTQKSWSRVSKMKLTSNGNFLQFLLEDASTIMFFEYDLKEKALINHDHPLLSLEKSSINLNDHIRDFWAFTHQATLFTKKFMRGQVTYDVCLYLLVEPSNTFYYIKLVQNLPSIQKVAEDVQQVITKRNQLFLITQGSKIEQIDRTRINFQSSTAYQLSQGQILQFISCNNMRRIWLLCKIDNDYYLKLLKLSYDHKFQEVLNTYNVGDIDLVKLMIQQKRFGFIEMSKQYNCTLYSANNQIFLLDSIFNNPNRKKALSFGNVIKINEEEKVLNNYPQVHQTSQKIANIIKTQKGPRKGIIIPALYSENKLKLQSKDEEEIKMEKVLNVLIEIEKDNRLQDYLIEYNISLQTFNIMNVKGQIVSSGDLTKMIDQSKGELIAISDSAQIMAFFNDQTNIINLMEFSIQPEDFKLVVNNRETYILPHLGISVSGIHGAMGALGQAFRAQSILNDNLNKTRFFINQNRDMLLCRQRGDIFEYMLYQAIKDKDGKQNDQKVVEIKVDQHFLGEQKNIQAALSNQNVIIWTDNKILTYDIETEHYSILSLQLSDKDILKFIDVYQINNCDHKFVIRIMNSFEYHMVVLWNENQKSEECSADVNYFSKIIQDSQGNIYIMDNEQGLISLWEEAGACKNISFRHILPQELKAKARRILVDHDQDIQETVQDFYKKGIIGNKVALDQCKSQNQQIKPLSFILLQRQVILPYSYIQLIIKDELEQIQKSRDELGVDYIMQYQNFVSMIPIKLFSFQLRNSTLAHILATHSDELEYVMKQFKKQDESLLDMLMTLDENQKTPLHIAFENNNTKCVNLIMTYMAIGCEETFGKYTKLFSSQFADLINYSSFKEFLQAAFYQSEQFKQITTLKVQNEKKLEHTGILINHETIVKDKELLKKITDSEENMERNVQVNCIRSDWILLTKDGDRFLQTLAESDDMELFDLKIIQTIVNYMWSVYKPKIIKFLFLPFILYFFIFIFAVTNLYFDMTFESISFSVDYVIYGLLVPLNFFFTFIEFKQLYDQGFRKYFNSVWNFIDIITLIAAFGITILMMITDSDGSNATHHSVICVLGAFAVIALYLKFFYFLRIFDNTAYFIRMIVQITQDIRYFFFIFLIGVIGFGNGFLILSRGNPESDQYITTFSEAVIYTYKMTLGDFDTGDFISTNVIFQYIVFILATLFIMIILFNLLIAIMGDTYAQIKQTEKQQTMKEHLQLIMDNQFLISSKQLCEGVKYIISVTLDDDEQQSHEVQYQNKKFDEIREYIDYKFDDLRSDHKRLETTLMKQMAKLLPASQMMGDYLDIQKKKKRFSKRADDGSREDDSLSVLEQIPERQKVTIRRQGIKLKKEDEQ